MRDDRFGTSFTREAGKIISSLNYPSPASGTYRGTTKSLFYKKWISSTGSRQRKDDDLRAASTSIEPLVQDIVTPPNPKGKATTSTPQKSTAKTALVKASAGSKNVTKSSSTGIGKSAASPSKDSPADDKDRIIAGLRKEIDQLKKAKNKQPKVVKLDSDEEAEPSPVRPHHPTPAKVKEQEGEPFSAGMYEGLDEIATAELYNWLGDQQPATRHFFASKTSYKFKKLLEDTQRRATEMDEYKTALRNYKSKGKSTVVQDKPKYNPDIPLVLGPYRSNAVLADTISHWHANKGHMGAEMEMVVSQITEELVPIIGVGPNRRGYSQLEDGDEYLEQVGLQCEDWWFRQGIPREVLHTMDQELGPIYNWFDQEERNPTSQILSKSGHDDNDCGDSVVEDDEMGGGGRGVG